MSALYVHRWGAGPRVVLVHGAVLGGRQAFRAQKPLAERWTLLAPDRLGHGSSPDGPTDFDTDAALIAEQLLGEPVHLLGYSYGGIVAMLAAAAKPDAVRSLTVVEPPAIRAARGDPVVEAWAETGRIIFGGQIEDLRERLIRFFAFAGVPVEVPDPLPAALERGARALATTRPPHEAELPLDDLTRAPFPKLVVTGGHMDSLERIGDAISGAMGAERAVVTGLEHLVLDTGEPFNQVFESFLAKAERAGLRAPAPRADTTP